MACDREIEDFLASHGPFVPPPCFPDGEAFGDWRTTAFLGRGGSAEVYRAVHRRTGAVAAVKVLVRSTETARARFAEEARLLASSLGEAFPRFHDSGELDGRPYVVEEYLEPYDLPERDRDVAAFLLRLCACVEGLHARGLVHRDLKPQNIMRRPGNDAPVLIDLGLVKSAGGGSSAGKDSLSVVEGRSVAVGTPGYSAPEQFTGGEVTPATDVHALGAIASACFGGRPPLFWRNIVYRATSSIPGQRYETAESLARAIRHRHRACFLAGGVLAVAALAVVGAVLLATPGATAPVDGAAAVKAASGTASQDAAQAFMRQIQEAFLDIEDRNHRRETVETSWREAAETAETAEANGFRILKVRLDDRILKVSGRVDVQEPARIHVFGPGTLDVDLAGGADVTVKIHNRGVLLNRSVRAYPDSGIRYDVGDGCYLNFVNQDWPKEGNLSHITVGGETAMLDYGGPTTYRDAQIKYYKSLGKALQNGGKQD